VLDDVRNVACPADISPINNNAGASQWEWANKIIEAEPKSTDHRQISPRFLPKPNEAMVMADTNPPNPVTASM
tara:strand:- start:168 stop:386 length:219 start_codon:yes stop_codon:yes gene_type:complete